jgi:hypothetical protein
VSSGVQIGSSLQAARKRRGLTLARVEEELHIREQFLDALEQEAPKRLPGDAYARAFLRVYGDYLDLDGPRLVDAWDEQFGPAEQGEIAPHQPLSSGWQSPVRPLVALGVSVLVLGAGAILTLGLTGEHSAATTTTTTAARPTKVVPMRDTKPKPAPPRQQNAAVPIRAVGAWDPFGDHAEHDSEAAAATDGSPLTYWRTETYSIGLRKPGVGLLLDAGRPVALRHLVVSTDTPGFRAVVQAGASAAGPFRPVSVSAPVESNTAFTLDRKPARFYVIWITQLDHVAHIDDVRAVARPDPPHARVAPWRP